MSFKQFVKNVIVRSLIRFCLGGLQSIKDKKFNNRVNLKFWKKSLKLQWVLVAELSNATVREKRMPRFETVTKSKSKTQKQEVCTISSIVLLTLIRHNKVYIWYIISLYQYTHFILSIVKATSCAINNDCMSFIYHGSSESSVFVFVLKF